MQEERVLATPTEGLDSALRQFVNDAALRQPSMDKALLVSTLRYGILETWYNPTVMESYIDHPQGLFADPEYCSDLMGISCLAWRVADFSRTRFGFSRENTKTLARILARLITLALCRADTMSHWIRILESAEVPTGYLAETSD